MMYKWCFNLGNSGQINLPTCIDQILDQILDGHIVLSTSDAENDKKITQHKQHKSKNM